MSQRWFHRKWWQALLMSSSLAAITVFTPMIANAYAFQMVHPPGFTPPMPQSNFVFHSFRSTSIMGTNSISGIKAPRVANVPLYNSMIPDMARTAMEVHGRSLWAMYPASVRGRVFGGTGSDPVLSPSLGVGGGGW